ncbi:MAG: YjbF family lipoprotein [Paracoccaceae bacterium]|nr:YjbF family lipoprotein [Paracoccaceae bacterium]
MTALPARARRAALAALLALLAGCGTAGDSPLGFALSGIVASLGGGGAKAAGEAALAAQLTPEALARATRPLLFAELPSRDARATFVIGGENRGHVTWLGADGIGLVLRGGVLTSTRGLGPDLLASDTAAAEAAIRRGEGSATRSHRYLGGENQVIARNFACGYISEGRATIEIVGTRHATRVVTERCAGGRTHFENRYWIGADGFVWQSTQWIGPEIGAVTLKQLVR